MKDLFDAFQPDHASREVMADGAVILRGKALAIEAEILAALRAITAASPFRHMTTPGGFVMSVAMTNCGAAGWVTDRAGYLRPHRPANRRTVAGAAGLLSRARNRCRA